MTPSFIFFTIVYSRNNAVLHNLFWQIKLLFSRYILFIKLKLNKDMSKSIIQHKSILIK